MTKLTSMGCLVQMHNLNVAVSFPTVAAAKKAYNEAKRELAEVEAVWMRLAQRQAWKHLIVERKWPSKS